MAKLFIYSSLSADTQRALRNECSGVYVVNLHGASVDEVDAWSKGFSREAIAVLLEHPFILCGTRYADDGTVRAYPIIVPSVYDPAQATLLTGGTFNANSLSSRGRLTGWNAYLSTEGALCRDCGKHFRAVPTRHTCGERLCADCGEPIPHNRTYCERCQRARIERVCDYHGRQSKRANKFHFERPHLRAKYCHLGPEIEMDGDHSFHEEEAREFSAILNDDIYAPFMEFERDGSLDGGCECITAPTTLKGFNNKAEAIREFYRKAKELGGRFGDNNGLHFHIDRAFFGERDSEKGITAQLFIELLVYKYYDFFKAISRRRKNNFGYACEKDGAKTLAHCVRNLNYQDHTFAVNGSSDKTIELRFFGGKIDNGDDFLACADIVNAIARWAKATTWTGAEKCHPADIVRYINDAENVRAFILYEREDRFKSRESERVRAEFLAKLDDKINGREAR